jgi:hypothetical protein
MNARLQANRPARTEKIMRSMTITAVAAAALIVFTVLPGGSDAVARGAGGFGGRGMSAMGARGFFGSRMHGTRFGAGQHAVGRREVGRRGTSWGTGHSDGGRRKSDFGRDRRMSHQEDGRWHEVRGFGADRKGTRANDGQWRKRSSFGSNEKGSHPREGEWHTE